MKALRRGDVPMPDTSGIKWKYHYPVDYHNAVFVIVFDPMMNIKIVIKLLGVMPLSVPMKDYLGNREKPDAIKPTYNYKSIDMHYEIIQSPESIQSSDIMKDFAKIIH